MSLASRLSKLAVRALTDEAAPVAGPVVRATRAPLAVPVPPKRRVQPKVRLVRPDPEDADPAKWLHRARAEASERYSQHNRLPGKLTASVKGRVELDPKKLANIPGAMGERRVPGDEKYDRLMASVQEKGFDPNTHIWLGVNHLGEPYIAEGNTRLAVARDLGIDRIPAEVMWYGGGEGVEGSMMPELLEKYMPPSELSLDPNFRRWFEGSQMADEYGEPMMFFHGTSKDADFRKMRVPRNGAWFAKSSKEASDYAMENDSVGFRPAPTRENPWAQAPVNRASRVMPVYLNAKNPMRFPDPREFSDILQAAGGDNYRRGQGLLFDRYRNEGFDSVVLGDNDVVTILRDPTQIKSASGNRGTYDLKDPDLRKARGGLAVRKPT